MKESLISAPVSAYTLCENTLCRRLRVGACPVLTVRVVYPMLVPSEGESADTREVLATEHAVASFNSCYAKAAETFAERCLRRLGTDLEAEYLALSTDRRYLYARCVVTCLIVPKEVSCGTLRVEISQRDERGKAREVTVRTVAEHLWQFPHGTFKRPPKLSKKL